MTKAEKKKYDAMETALRVIHKWANYFHAGDSLIDHVCHMENLKAIADKCLEALGKKK